MPLTPEQKNNILGSLDKNVKPEGVSNVDYLTGIRDNVSSSSFNGSDIDRGTERREDISETKEGLQGAFSGFKQKIRDIRQKTFGTPTEEKEQSQISGIVQSTGATAKLFTESLGTLTIGAGKLLLPQKTEDAVKNKASELIGGFIETNFGGEGQAESPEAMWEGSTLKKDFWDKLNDEQKENVKGVLSTGEAVAELTGLGALKDVATRNLKDVVTNFKKITPEKVDIDSSNVFKDTFKGVSDVIEDVTPKKIDFADRQVAQALNLAPVTDIARFKELTGNDLGEFLSRNDVIKNTTKETVTSLAEFQKKNFNSKKDLVSLIEERFTFEDLPQFEGLVDNLIKQMDSSQSPEFKAQADLLRKIKESGDFDLSQVEYVKSLSDDVDSFYNRFGDVRDSFTLKDQENLVRATRRFIEERVSEVYPEVDIRKLNNNTQSSRFILDAIAKRAGKADTQSIASLGDYAVLGIGGQLAPGLGIAALIGKKVLEAPSLRLRTARALYGKKGVDVSKKELDDINKLITSELDAIIKDPSK